MSLEAKASRHRVADAGGLCPGRLCQFGVFNHMRTHTLMITLRKRPSHSYMSGRGRQGALRVLSTPSAAWTVHHRAAGCLG
eukprot:5485553-Prymnesium_polylepis.1